jgi:DNA-binding response OmpR family regulator
MTQVLVVEDDEAIGALLERSLRSHGYAPLWTRSGQAALRAARSEQPELVLLDLGLPDLDGLEVCRRLRSGAPGAVIIMLTARDEEMDVVVGLDAGADDYLTKPVGLAELHARLRAHRRRIGTADGPPPSYRLGALEVDTAARKASVHGRGIELRAREFDLLARFAAEPGVALSRSTLMSDVWGQDWFGQSKTLDVHVAALRRKITEAADGGTGEVPEIVTLRGHGFRFELSEP